MYVGVTRLVVTGDVVAVVHVVLSVVSYLYCCGPLMCLQKVASHFRKYDYILVTKV